MYRKSTSNMKYDSVNGVGIPQSVQQLTTGWLAEALFSARDFSLSHSVCNGSVANPASYPGNLWLGIKGMVHETDHSPPPSMDNGGAITPTSPYITMHVVVLN
jgi:hypothetical protein